jgi:uncharacterized protein (UPF0333 family)
MKGQGALEYLLILAAVLAIAAIVIYVVSSAGRGAQEDALRKDCTCALSSCQFYKVAIGVGAGNLTACESTCKPCASLDKFLNDTGKEPGAAYNSACLAAAPA